MKKIIFEQTGNVVTIILLMMTMLQAVNLEQTHSENTLFRIEFGYFLVLFIIWIIIFGLLRFFISKRSHGHYNREKGEFSVEDEREQMIQFQTIKISYTVLFALVIGSLFISFLSYFLLSDTTIMIKLIIISLCLSIVATIITYTAIWSYKYIKL